MRHGLGISIPTRVAKGEEWGLHRVVLQKLLPQGLGGNCLRGGGGGVGTCGGARASIHVCGTSQVHLTPPGIKTAVTLHEAVNWVPPPCWEGGCLGLGGGLNSVWVQCVCVCIAGQVHPAHGGLHPSQMRSQDSGCRQLAALCPTMPGSSCNPNPATATEVLTTPQDLQSALLYVLLYGTAVVLIECWVDTRLVSGMWHLSFGYHYVQSQHVLIGIRCMPAVLRRVATHASKWLDLVGHGSQCTAHAWEFTADLLPTVIVDQTSAIPP